MNKTAYILVFDGLADWEPALALSELNKRDDIDVVTVGFSEESVISMGGLKVVPDITLSDTVPGKACVFILPGGEMWEKGKDSKELKDVLMRMWNARVPIAAICGATLALVRMGMVHGVRHTSNGKEYLLTLVPEYQDEEYYVDSLAVSDQNIITASGVGYVEFAREIITLLNLYSETDTHAWFDLFKYGILPGNSP